MPSTSSVIAVQDLCKRYGSLTAVNGISFAVKQGEIFGMVGPNGAGKTTTIECIEGLRQPDGGAVRVFDHDPRSERQAVALRMGIQLQQSALPPRLHVGEAMELFAAFAGKTGGSDDLLGSVGLAAKRDAVFSKLSGGEKQRLFVALALVNQPDVVFLDELTTGLDPQGRHSMWDLVRRIRDDGCTVFLTTHFMEEAERLCDRVLIIDHGRIIALDTPEALIRSLGIEKRLVLTVQNGQPLPPLKALPQVERVEQLGERVSVFGHGERFASAVVGALEDAGVHAVDLRTEQPNLEDVFLSLTGREIRE